MLKEIFSKTRTKKAKTTLEFGPVSVEVDEQNLREILFVYSIENTGPNLRRAEKNGVKPLTLGEVIDQINSNDLARTVLFDTPPVRGFAGNHWRILEIDKLQESGMLQICGTFGNYDYDLIPPLKVSLNTPLFTGLSVQEYELDGRPISLRETVKLMEESERRDSYPKLLKHRGDIIFWSNSQGELVESGKHVAFRKD